MEQFYGVREIANALGVSKQRASQLVRQKGFPDPVAMIGDREGWRPRDVTAWIRRNRATQPTEGSK
jgi:predicted DNA-binding transcriptional regulator AlpA